MSDKKAFPSPSALNKAEGNSVKRLPSFKAPRDLRLSEFKELSTSSLAAKPKRTFIPNLNVTRKRQEEHREPAPIRNETPRQKDREKNQEDKGRHIRPRKPRNFIQGCGVFSEGLAPSLKTGRWSSGGGKQGGSYKEAKPHLNLERNKHDKAEDESIITELMRDDFISDPDLEPDMAHAPVKLPLQEIDWKEFKVEKDELGSGMMPAINGMAIKSDPETQKEELKEVENSSGKPETQEEPRLVTEMKPLTASQLLAASATGQDYIFFHVPNAMPRLKIDAITPVPQIKTEKGVSKAPEESQGLEKNVLRSLPAGKIGKLQLLKSGRARLVLGDVNLWIEPGIQFAFKQDLMSMELNSENKSGDMINLGPITTKMMIVPDWESLIKKSFENIK